MRTRISRRRAARGQAVVELVLGLIVFVTVLIFAIHFGEVGFLSVKVTEAQHSAIFDATGRKLHNWESGTDTGPASTSASKSGSEAQSRYADFDSRTQGSGKSLTQVFTQASNMRVQCAVGGGPKYSQAGLTKGAYGDNGGINCEASARLSATGIPTQFLDGGSGSFFKDPHYKPVTINVCSMGRGGSCSGKLTMLLDDWGLTGTNEAKECQMKQDSATCKNKAFWRMGESVFKKNGAALGMQGSLFAMGIVYNSPINENQYWMSAPGEESKPAFQTKLSSTEGAKQFETTPGAKGKYKDSYDKRKTCWLGLDCP